MLKKVVVSLVAIMALALAVFAQVTAVSAETSFSSAAPISSAIRVVGRVLYRYNGHVRPAPGAFVVVRNGRGTLVTTVRTDVLGRYTVNASGSAYYVLRVHDAYGTDFDPDEKWVKAGMQLTNVDFWGFRKP